MKSFNPQLLDRFGPNAKAWIFTLTRPIGRDEAEQLSEKVDTFLSTWTAHKQELQSMSLVIDSQILLIVADATASGCAIDVLFTQVGAITAALNMELNPIGMIILRNKHGALSVMNRNEFRQAFKNHEFDLSAEVLNSVASTAEELRPGIFQRLHDTPFAKLLSDV